MSKGGISIHALREEGDGLLRAAVCQPRHFYPRPPRGGRRTSARCACSAVGISIHALREEGDLHLRQPWPSPPGFLSTPSARRATWASSALSSTSTFLSTPSARRATGGLNDDVSATDHFYPRPPRGGRRR
nr:MAG TPA: hypothetical protein [Caudoviricetes sp.]